MSALNDPALVAREYADEAGLSARIAAQKSQSGPDPWNVAFAAGVSPARACASPSASKSSQCRAPTSSESLSPNR